MSMAEPRRRKKWSLNPRGTLWANDDNKYGQKLMEKMGWSKGSGLGREEQGIKEHLTVKFKDDNKGIGFTGSDDQWIKHYEGFESVLANLNSQENAAVNSSGSESPYNSTVTKTSLETSSKTSKARVHYHKFTRGKDLSQCSEDDLGCILGSKRAKRLAEVKSSEEDVTESDDAVGTMEHSMGVTTIKGCSIQVVVPAVSLVVAAVVTGTTARAASQSAGYGGGGGAVDGSFAPASYAFQWDVNDANTGSYYGHREQREGVDTQGSYFVQLPDSRTLRVDYVADEGGYRPTITYEGEAQYPTGPQDTGRPLSNSYGAPSTGSQGYHSKK